jgi:hypothetical protein
MPNHPLITGLAIYGCYEALRKVGLVKDIECPAAITDKLLGRKNKKQAIAEANYGPLPFGKALSTIIGRARDLPILTPAGNADFWAGKDPQQVCGDCAHFDISPPIIACGGASERPILVPSPKGPILTTPEGYCRKYEFKCSALRTCDKWAAGGPIGSGPLSDYSV